MRRFITHARRPDWEQIVQDENLVYDTDPEDPDYHYWTEDVVYGISTLELADFQAQVKEVHELVVKAADWLAAGGYGTMGLPQAFFDLAVASWKTYKENYGLREMDVAGRYDFALVQDQFGDGAVLKLLEYNADTPTMMVEAAVCQTSHFDYHFAGDARFTTCNYIGDAFINRWEEILATRPVVDGYIDNEIWFTCLDSDEFDLELAEDQVNTKLMMHCAEMAGWKPRFIALQDICFNYDLRRFETPDGTHIRSLWKLYPWEDIALDSFAEPVLETYGQMAWFEPAWKMLFSNKYLLAALWELNPHHPNLVPAFMGAYTPELNQGQDKYARKPIFGRQGAGITVHDAQGALLAGEEESLTLVADEECVYQQWIETTNFPDETGDHYPTFGVWVVKGEVVGFAIRDQDTPIITDDCHFVPLVVDL